MADTMADDPHWPAAARGYHFALTGAGHVDCPRCGMRYYDAVGMRGLVVGCLCGTPFRVARLAADEAEVPRG